MVKIWNFITRQTRVKYLEKFITEQNALIVMQGDWIEKLTGLVKSQFADLSKIKENYSNMSKMKDSIEHNFLLQLCAWNISNQNNTDRFSILSQYVERIASAIAGEKVSPFLDSRCEAIDKALEEIIYTATKQREQLLYARIEAARLEDLLAQINDVLVQVPSDQVL